MYDDSATWGIPSESFLVMYVTIAVLAVGLAVFLRSRGHEPAATGRVRLDPVHAGMLTSDDRAIAASLTLLRGADLISPDGTVLRSWAVTDNTLGSFTRTVYDELAFGRTALGNLGLAGRLRAPLDQLRSTLVAQGLLTGPEQKAWNRRATLPILVVVALGVARLVAGFAGGKPIGFLLVLVILVSASRELVRRTGRRTRRGTAELDRLRRTHSYLAPRMRPSFTAYGPTPIALSTALFGAGAVALFSPGFASAAGISDSGSSDGGSGGGNSSCGGGGCGGGGCGG
ncbi:TIGR04222 domain-containing membrane protein [Rhodococcus sp. WS4]|nr:TIGR04222 domain-containing membrane protein [Rhodococcus sp. WS4]